MSVLSLIDQIIDHPNSTFTPESVGELEMLSESLLQQILFGLARAPEKDVQTMNSAANSQELQKLMEDLNSCQSDLQHAAKEETRILTELQKHGVKRASVLSYNTTNAAPITEAAIQKYFQSAVTPYTMVMNEGVMARRELRSKAINDILMNTAGVYTANDLDRMPSMDLNKLSEALRVKVGSVQQPDYSAMMMADGIRQVSAYPTPGYGEGVITNDPIDPPKLQW